MGNRKIIIVDVSSTAGSTSDTVHLPGLTAAPVWIEAMYRSTTPIFGTAWTSAGQIGLAVTTAARGFNVTVARSSDGIVLPFSIRAEGR